MTIRPYLIIPNLILQPTWGGEYIAQFKRLNHQALSGQKIGQSYELYEYTNISPDLSTRDNPMFEIGESETPNHTVQYVQTPAINLQTMINIDPSAVLGSHALLVHGPKIGILIKFTQAKGNSYQLHVPQDTAKWLTKPESWYFFEPGYITVGIKPETDWAYYEEVSHKLYKTAQELSAQIKSGQISHSQADQTMRAQIKASHIEDCVNRITTNKDDAIDLSACGIHHSWEEDDQKFPLGNVLYEVQKNTFDPVSTIRNFDKGKFKADGSIRSLQIEDYFKYIDRSPAANDPDLHLIKQKILARSHKVIIRQIFENTNYKLQELELSGSIAGDYTTTADSFHHLFAKSGDFTLKTKHITLTVTQGYSVFVPANTGIYELVPVSQATILKTYV